MSRPIVNTNVNNYVYDDVTMSDKNSRNLS